MEILERKAQIFCPLCGGTAFHKTKKMKQNAYCCANCSSIYTSEELLGGNIEQIEESFTCIAEEMMEKHIKKLGRGQ